MPKVIRECLDCGQKEEVSGPDVFLIAFGDSYFICADCAWDRGIDYD